MKTVYLIRHGESEANASPVFQGNDSPLTPKGQDQAKQIAERVSHLNFETLIASPLKRAKQTAGAISKKTEKEIKYSELFVERKKPTSIHGKSYADEAANIAWREWEKSVYTPQMKVADGENYDELTKRSKDALEFLENREEESILVVTHGYFLRSMVLQVITEKNPTPEIAKTFHKNSRTGNTGLTILKYEDGFEEEARWRLYVYNDQAHLAE